MGTFINSDTVVSNDIPTANGIAGSEESTSASFREILIHENISNITEPESKFLPCSFMVKINDQEYWCLTCSKCFSDRTQLEDHVEGEQHSKVQKKFGCKHISLKGNKHYYCGCCDDTLESLELAFQHITGEGHMINANLPCISIKSLHHKKYFCGICNVQSSGERDLEFHVHGARHKKAQKEYQCENIVLRDDHLYHCRCCDSVFLNRKLTFEHIKKKKHMTALKELHKEGQPTREMFPNVAEATKQPKIELSSNSIKEEKPMTALKVESIKQPKIEHVSNSIKEGTHMSDGHLPCISIKPLKDKKFFCEICNVESSGDIDLETHVKGARHRTAQMVYGCNNIFVQKDSKYYCGCCDHILANRQFALDHIKEEKHKSNSNLPCISIKLVNKNEYHCRICNVAISSKIDLHNHVNGRRHIAAQNNYGCNNISLREDNLYHCGWCNCTLKSRKHASDHIEEKHMNNVELPCISIMPVDMNKYHCTICNVDISGKMDLENHVKNRQHANIQKDYGCRNVLRKEDNLYYCGCCGCALMSRKLASEHIKEEKHKSNANLPCISLMLVDTEKYYCRICDMHLSNPAACAGHLNGRQHREAQKKYGCNQISLKPGNNLYYCERCDCTLESRRLASQHIKEEEHMSNANLSCISAAVKVSNKEGQTTIKTIPNVAGSTKQPKIDLVSNSIKEEKHMSNGHLPCISIKPLKDKKFFCGICYVESCGEIDLETHVKGLRHRTAQMVYGCNNILVKKDSKYYCKCCDLTLSSREVASQHIKEEKHVTAVKVSNKEGQTTIKTIPNVAESTKQPKIDLVSNSIKEGTHMSDGHLPCISIKPLKDKKFFCEICNVESSGEIDLETHVKGARHRTAQMVYGCNNIFVQKDSKYYCGCCDHILANRQFALEHIKEEKHKSNSNLPCISIKLVNQNEYHCRICNVAISSEIDLHNHVNGRRHIAAQSNYGCNNISLRKDNLYHCGWCNCSLRSRKHASDHIVENHMNHDELRCISIMPVDINKYHCIICNVDISGKMDLENHVKDRQHVEVRKNYGCDSIYCKKDNLYYCRCCDCALTSRKLASEHIIDGKHRSNAILPCISLTLVDIDKYYCTICDKHLLNPAAFASHQNGRQHKEAQKRYGCDQISLKPGNLYYCERCDCTLKSRRLASEHIKGKQHMSNPNLPCISIKLVSVNKYQCRICNVNSLGKKDLENHVIGARHKEAQIKYGCYTIGLNESHLYYCKCCNSDLSNREVASKHIKEEKHMIALKLSEKEDHLTTKEIPKTAESTKGSTQPKSISGPSCKNLLCSYILEENTTDSYCAACDRLICGKKNVEAHAKANQHVTAVKKFSDNKILPKERYFYYCKYCSYKISGFKNAHEHMAGDRHALSINKLGADNQEQKTIKTIAVKPESKKSDNVFVFTPRVLLYNFLVEVGENFECRVCNTDVTKGKDHIMANQHKIGLQKFYKNQISFIKNDQYHCKYCSCDIYGFENVHQHMEGYRHAISMPINKSVTENQEQETSNTIPVKVETKKRDNVSVFTAEILRHNFIVKLEENLHCKVCNTDVTKGTHIMENRHKMGLQKFHENTIWLKKNTCYCKTCTCYIASNWNVNQHVKGKTHIHLLKLFLEKSKPAKQSVANESKVNVEPNLQTTSSSVSSKLLKSEQQLSKAASTAKNGKSRASKKSRASQKVSAEKGQMRCSVCNAIIEGETNLHIHMALHFSNDFIAPFKDEKPPEEKAVTKTKNTSQFKLTEDINCNETAVKKIERTINMKKILKALDFDASNIYSIEDKSADIKLGMQLCYPIDEEHTYCFVCQMQVENSIEDYHQHLRTLGHCEYLDLIENDHKLFDPFPEQFSQLDLALQYMIETEDDYVYCFICDREFNDIQEHIYEKNHYDGCVQLHTKAKKNFENVKLIGCDWYEIQTYWCVPCMTRCRSEVNFAKHLKSQPHADCMNEKQNKKRKLIFDFCAPCALLWYGYRCTSAYHDDIQTHKWLTRDGHYASNEMPESAKLLLANPEDYVNKTIRYFDDISAKERDKEATLIRDIEKTVEAKFLHAKAFTFGSRISGLGSPDSDIDVFLDCGNMYDGEPSSMHRILNYMTDVHECLSQEPHLWDVEELLTMCRSPIIRAHHRITGLSCDISFENGLAVENTLLIKSFNDIFPPCRKMILIIKEWLKLCQLSGSERITSYAVYWFVIFYLQMESILPSVATLIEMKNKSHIIAGWEVGVIRDFISNAPEQDFSLKELLIRFFKFYANFDYRHEVACPLLSEIVAKRSFTDPESLPEAMGPYKAYVKNSSEPFRIDSDMCIQDPFDLQHNLSKAVSKVYLNRFRKYCLKSLDVLYEF